MLALVTILNLLGAGAGIVELTCPEDKHRTADPRTTSAFVAWDRAAFLVQSTRPIKSIYQTVPIYGAAVQVNRAFFEGSHFIGYRAEDDEGSFDTCSFTVTINVIRCPMMHNPQFGIITCDSGNFLGSTCVISCLPGYAVVGSRKMRCGEDGQWSNDYPFCKTTTCPDPGTPLHGTRLCTTVTHAYGSICSFACNTGFQLIGQSRLICKVDGENTFWSSPTPMCKEIISPTLELCPSDIEVTTSTKIFEVAKPRVIFRSMSGKELPHYCTYFGDQNSYNFTVDTYHISCRAYEPTFGEMAVTECKFTIKIRTNPCLTLHRPRNGFLLCSRAQGGDTSILETTCRLFCDNGYALPRADAVQNGVFYCDHTGSWQPSDQIPGCVLPKRPQELQLPTEISYATNDCNNTENINEVRVAFQAAAQATIRMQHMCATNPGVCIVEDVVASCRKPDCSRRWRQFARSVARRDYSSHWRRRVADCQFPENVHILPIKFHFATRVAEHGGRWPDKYHEASNRLFGMFDFFERLVMEESFTISSRVNDIEVHGIKKSLTYAPIKAICDIGHKFNQDILLCVSCGPGAFYSLEQDKCIICPKGEYQNEEAQFQCKQCPNGTYSQHEGASDVSQCLDIDDCISNPCLNRGRCIDGHSSYTCHCTSGFTGVHCEIPMFDCARHSCLNGGTCIPTGKDSHACKCAPQFTGQYCMFPAVDAGWTPWAQWSPCSHSCGAGTMERQRFCSNPSPVFSGKPCRGAATQMKVCNHAPCARTSPRRRWRGLQ